MILIFLSVGFVQNFLANFTIGSNFSQLCEKWGFTNFSIAEL